jgi:hypothetical protein
MFSDKKSIFKGYGKAFKDYFVSNFMIEAIILLKALSGEPDSLNFGYDKFREYLIGDKIYESQFVGSYDFNGNGMPDAYAFFELYYKNGLLNVQDFAKRLILDPNEDLNGEIEFLDTDNNGVLDKKNVFP